MKGKRMPNCKTCGTEIVFFRNENGKFEPFDARPARVLEHNMEYKIPGSKTIKAHIGHFITCPQRDQHRRKK